MKVSGNDLFVTAMKKEGVDTIFAYPGGMVVNLLDALHDCHGIDLVLPRHEQGLIHAADGYARATGKVGVCLVTSGPGATNLVTGIATANYDSIPLVCFTGQVPEHLIGNDAFQEVDIIGVTRNIAKFVIMVRDREMLAQRIKEAFYIARSGKPGPVLVDLPTDVMAELGSTSYPTEVNIRGYKPNKGVHVGQLKKAINLLEEAKKPMFLIGGGVNLARAQEEMTVAYHEIGHALVAAKQTNSAPVQKITIIPRTSGALGYTMQVEQQDKYLMTKEEIQNKIATLTGGRAAEEIVTGTISTGASNDIEQATKLARAMITRYGMSDDFDMVAMESVQNQYLGGDTSLACSFETQTEIDKKVVELVKTQHAKAYKILEDNIGKLHQLAKYLYDNETITGEEFMKILAEPMPQPGAEE